ncbi:hypothetical protein ESCNG_900003 [Neisseria gonorrhoeae]|nr:hypothetical protein ESCNG_900003 [Neisseria gonorrhoeae]
MGKTNFICTLFAPFFINIIQIFNLYINLIKYYMTLHPSNSVMQ